MWWWTKARRAHALLPAALALVTVLVLLVRDTVAQMPSFLTGGDNPMTAMLFVPVPLCSALLMSLESRLLAAEDASARPVRPLDAGLTLAVVGGAAVVGLGADAVLDSGTAVDLGRNTAFLTGLTLCVRALAGPPAVLAPVVWCAAIVFLGFDRSGHPAFWTVLPRAHDDSVAATAAVLTLSAGLAVQLCTRPRTAS
ncbi:hypothetical protein ACFWZT_36635 [Streptomyces alboflavus]|uniref:hypothetical protein n=1 Tax=Streptomyces alboflavus TaxID=67267 RepID=UPI0036B24ADF